MTSTDHIDIHIASDQDMNQAFVDAWQKAEQGRLTEPEEHLYFEDAATLLRVLSNRRLSLLSALRRSGPSSIRSLSKMLQRNYKNVHSDVTLLRKAGLVRRDGEDRVFVPWQKIYTEIDLLAVA
jgi:predicted transcriptional regulator